MRGPLALALAAGENAPLFLEIAHGVPGAVDVRRTGLARGARATVWAAMLAPRSGESDRHAAGADGRARLPALLPGAYLLYAETAEPHALALAPATVVVEPGAEIALAFAVATHAGVLRVRDERTGAPLAGAEIHVAPIGAGREQPLDGASVQAIVQGDGRARLALAPGRYAVVAGDPTYHDAARIAHVAWTERGPIPDALALTPVAWPAFCPFE